MKTIIAGPRDFTNYDALTAAITGSGFEITEVVSGGAEGVDSMGERWAREHGVPCRTFHAQWKALGRAAGPIRNGRMAEYADALIAVRKGDSPGTRDMIARASRKGLKVCVVDV
jgi:YspA, cpYpsA-related SLOG family